jgi:hypothetical protein
LRFAWAMLPTSCDREGRFKWRPRVLKLDILPYDSCDFSAVLDAWLTRGFVVKYRVGDEWYGWIPTFLTHQVPNNREQASQLPSFEQAEEKVDHRKDQLLTRGQRVNGASVTVLEKESVEGKGTGREGEGNNASHTSDLNATECAMAQARELRISDQRTIEAMRAQIQLESDDSKKSCEYASLKVKSAIEDYQASSEKLAYTLPIDKFLGQGLWRNRDGWPWKNKPNSDWKPAVRIDYAAMWKKQEGE